MLASLVLALVAIVCTTLRNPYIKSEGPKTSHQTNKTHMYSNFQLQFYRYYYSRQDTEVCDGGTTLLGRNWQMKV